MKWPNPFTNPGAYRKGYACVVTLITSLVSVGVFHGHVLADVLVALQVANGIAVTVLPNDRVPVVASSGTGKAP